MFILLIDKFKGFNFDPIISILSVSFVELNFFFSVVDDAGDPATEDRPGFVV